MWAHATSNSEARKSHWKAQRILVTLCKKFFTRYYAHLIRRHNNSFNARILINASKLTYSKFEKTNISNRLQILLQFARRLGLSSFASFHMVPFFSLSFLSPSLSIYLSLSLSIVWHGCCVTDRISNCAFKFPLHMLRKLSTVRKAMQRI